jgi:catechol 2,3-dioxygenase
MATSVGATQEVSIHPDTSIGAVRLTVADLRRSQSFYEQAIGLRAFDRAGGTLALGTDPDRPLIELRGDASAPALDQRATGLFHLAIVVPTRPDLAFALARLAQARWPLDGASDHLVSEALYLSDPDGNGIEIYRDRPRGQWPHDGDGLRMATMPLDLDDVLGELARAQSLQPLAPPGTQIGHVHLQVSDLTDAEQFYAGVVGLDVMVRGYPGALFVSAGGYHHHIGLNTWRSAGASPPPPGSIGLRSFELVLPTPEERDRVLGRIRAAGLPIESSGDEPLVRDTAGNGVVLRSASSS